LTRVLLIIIDALSDRHLRPLLEDNSLPAFRALSERGQLLSSVSIFPSITHACLSSIATGDYPRAHHVLGAHWYLPKQGEEAYYGTDPEFIYNKGIKDFFEDFMVELNGRRLKARTVFQDVEEAGLSAASLNFMIFKGDVEHDVNLPFLLQLLPNIEDGDLTVNGPSTLYLGQFLQRSAASLPELEVQGGLSNWFGFHDNNTVNQLRQLAEAKAFPDFTLAYFPRNDYLSHSEGPRSAHHQLIDIDQALAELFASYGSIDSFLADMCLIITGDHSQSPIQETDDAGIALESFFDDALDVAMRGETWDSDEDIMACPNLRAAQLYFKDPHSETIKKAIDIISRDERIDQVIWRADLLGDFDGYIIQQGSKRISFKPGDQVRDRFGNGWNYEGDLAAADGQVEGDQLTFPDYPNAFERVAGVLDCEESGHLWLTARPGYEFDMPMAGIHAGGGSHGSLHAGDSLTSLLLAGHCGELDLPAMPRLVDIKSICLALLGLDGNH
jgi:hypothetical protein